MKRRCSFKSVIFVAVGLALVFAGNSAKAESTELAKIWDCAELLDPETKSALTGYERFFADLSALMSSLKALPGGRDCLAIGAGAACKRQQLPR